MGRIGENRGTDFPGAVERSANRQFMSKSDSKAVTQLLQAANDGDAQATEKLLPLVYDELRRLAKRKMAALPVGRTLQPTALVHEVYMRMVGSTDDRWENRRHFFAAAARAMRNILVDRARRKGRIKHGGGRHRVSLDVALIVDETPSVDLVPLDDALRKLEEYDKRKSDVVMLRYFAGLTIDEISDALDVSVATVERDWAYSKAWLHRELSKSEAPPSSSPNE